MNTPVFTGKLDALPATLEFFREYDASPLAIELAAGDRRHVVSVGSGGSLIAAEYLSRCRDALGLGPTTVQTPMQVVLDQQDLTESDVWLFSAGGDNPDAVAAALAAHDRNARSINIVTRNPGGAAAGVVERGSGNVHVVPVAEPKDGYLATHSLLSFFVALLLACDAVSRDPLGKDHFLEALGARLTDTRTSRIDVLSQLRRTDTVLIANDPLLRSIAVLFETSIWEASLCHVQAVDFRNLAHGRHAWLHHRTDETLIIALTGVDSRSTWAGMDALLPTPLRRLTCDFGSCGRLDNALSLVDGFGLLEAMGEALGIDPGKPGIGEFGRPLYEEKSLVGFAETMPANVRHKRAAIAKSDAYVPEDGPLEVIGRNRLEIMSQADIGGVVFDYDGTVVSTARRWSGPDQIIVDELVRLHRLGLKIGFATGRGGSAGEDLRKALPADMLDSVLIGYYNGAHLRTADVDIKYDRPLTHPAITETAEWLQGHGELFVRHEFKHGEVQITVDMGQLYHPYRFFTDMKACPPFADGRVRVSGSGHSYDIIPASSCKLSVVEAMQAGLPDRMGVLCFGDSGSRLGNDHALLSHRFGISVGEVCGAAHGCWSLFGSVPSGPDALHRILRALVSSESGMVRFDVTSLELDRR